MLSTLASLPLAIKLVLALLIGEIGFYWGHRLSHQISFLWRFHSIHHSAQTIDFLVNTRAHPVDMVATPAFHHWHHSRADHPNHNYAALLPVLDRVFGTHYLPSHWPADYGIDAVMPGTLVGQLISPLQGRLPV